MDPPHPVEGGSANDYDYAMGDPLNRFDLEGEACVFSNGDGCLDIPEIFGFGKKGVAQAKRKVSKVPGVRPVSRFIQKRGVSALNWTIHTGKSAFQQVRFWGGPVICYATRGEFGCNIPSS